MKVFENFFFKISCAVAWFLDLRICLWSMKSLFAKANFERFSLEIHRKNRRLASILAHQKLKNSIFGRNRLFRFWPRKFTPVDQKLTDFDPLKFQPRISVAGISGLNLRACPKTTPRKVSLKTRYQSRKSSLRQWHRVFRSFLGHPKNSMPKSQKTGLTGAQSRPFPAP